MGLDGSDATMQATGQATTQATAAQTASQAAATMTGVTDAFLTRLDDIDGFGNHHGINGDSAPSGMWYLYGRPTGDETGETSADTSGDSHGGTPSDGVYAWVSADLRHWSNAGCVLRARNIPWVSTGVGHNRPDNRIDHHFSNQYGDRRIDQSVHHNTHQDGHQNNNQGDSDSHTSLPMPPAQTNASVRVNASAPTHPDIPTHPAVIRYKGKVYLFFEVDGQIGVAWASSPAGPFTARRTPILRRRQWGRATDPGVLGLPVEVDEFGQILPVSGRPARTDWLMWGGGAVTLCTLGEDRMELALGVHRSREIRIAPEGASRFGSPQIVRLGGEFDGESGEKFYLLWIDDAGRILSASAPHLNGPWKGLGPVVFDDTVTFDDAGPRDMGLTGSGAGGTGPNGTGPESSGTNGTGPDRTGLESSGTNGTVLDGKRTETSAGTSVPLRLSVAVDATKESMTEETPQHHPDQAILTVSDRTSTHFLTLRVVGTQLHVQK